MLKKGTAAALGTFDGIHTGHKAVLNNALKYSNPLCVTFNAPPKNAPVLLPLPQKTEMLKNMGFKQVVALDFNGVKDLSAQEFLDILVQKYGIDVFCCGFNYRFGKNADGNVEFLQNYCKLNKKKAIIENEVFAFEESISSSKIRTYILNGKVDKAEKLLGRYFGFTAKVVDGDKRGRVLGFPTVNQLLPDNICVPKFGVYASQVVVDGKKYKSVTNLGVRPTFLLSKPLAETHIIGFDGDLYGKTVPVELVKFLRPEQKFKNINQLKNAIREDLKSVYYSIL